MIATSQAERSIAEPQGHAALSKSEQQLANRRAAWRWGSLVVGLLGLQVLLGVGAVVLALNDKSAAVVPGYHEKALQWDEQMAVERQSQALGWDCRMEAVKATDGSVGLSIKLVDNQERPVDVAQGELQIYHHARASQVRRIEISSAVSGPIEIEGCFDREGRWQVELDIRDLDGNRFVTSREMTVSGTVGEQD